MITVKTDFPIAVDSADHIHPEGIYYDNSLHIPFVEQLEKYFPGEKINFMDIGCAGGELVCEMHRRGHKSVGLEGSDHCLNVREEMIEEVGFEPAGKKNWQQYANNILFTCDASKPFSVMEDGEQIKFDVITCFDVVEHFNPEDLDTFIQNVRGHLKDTGMFLATIALYPAGRHESSKNTPEGGVEYHKSVFPVVWWQDKFKENGMTEYEFTFDTTNRGLPFNTYICWWQKTL